MRTSLSKCLSLLVMSVLCIVATAAPWQPTNAGVVKSGTAIESAVYPASAAIVTVHAWEPEAVFQVATVDLLLPVEDAPALPAVCAIHAYASPYGTTVPYPPDAYYCREDTLPRLRILETVYHQEVLDTGGLALLPSHEVLRTFPFEARHTGTVTLPARPVSDTQRCRGTDSGDTPATATKCACANCAANQRQ